ncbi:hypothetical protein EVAR_441_1 [Eumeta japonica]|uniref:Uncharacterized protein n=1 Tax=Eumeta variegata TaxID=151549 RepID=A0A4C1SDD6_EUMVA|nr:hypothetical protein EVAR_441_1 [Eumeta japonica]
MICIVDNYNYYLANERLRGDLANGRLRRRNVKQNLVPGTGLKLRIEPESQLSAIPVLELKCDTGQYWDCNWNRKQDWDLQLVVQYKNEGIE